eukprot:gene12075-13993_t
MGTSQSSQDDSAVRPIAVTNDQSESKEADNNKPDNATSRNVIVKEIASMIMNGRRNSTDDWIEFVYSFATRLCDELRRDAATEDAFCDRNTLHERVKRTGVAMIKADPTDPQLQKLKEMSLFNVEPIVEVVELAAKEEERDSPRAHPLAGSSMAPTFQWRAGTTSSEGAAKSRNRAAWDIPDVEFPENSSERNAVLKTIVKLLSTKRCNSTENWHRACPQLANRLEGMLYKHAPILAAYSDLSTVTERVLQFVTLGGFKKPFQVKVVRQTEHLDTYVVPPKVLPKLNAQFSGTIPDSSSAKNASASLGKTAEAPHSDTKRGRPRKSSAESPEPVASTAKTATTSSNVEKPLSPAPKDLLQRQQQRLLLLQHAARCTHDEAHGTCPVTPHCASMKALWQHVQQCSLIKCPTPHCVSSRYVLSHWCNCADADCRMCQPAREGSDAHLKRITAEEQAAARSLILINQAQPQATSSSSEHASSLSKRKPSTQLDEEGPVSPSKKKLKEQGVTGTKENVVNFGDLSSPQAKHRLSAADKAYRAGSGGSGGGHRGGDAGSVHSAHSARSGISLHSHTSKQSRHSAASGLSRGSSHLSPRGTAGSSSNRAGGTSNTAQWIQRLFLPVIEELLQMPGAELVFGQPVDPAALGLPNYFDVIKHPMDLGTVRQTLQMRHYKDVQDLLSDVQQTFANAMIYNRVGTEVFNLAKKLRMMFNEKSRKPRFELSAKLEELRAQREARVAPQSVSSMAVTSVTAVRSVAVFQDAPNKSEPLSGVEKASETALETAGTGASSVRQLCIEIPNPCLE